MLKTSYLLSIILALVILLSCSSSMKKESLSTDYSANLGTATSYDFKEKTQRLLMRYQYELVRFEETSDQIYYETEWKNRTPFDDELELGIVEGRTRFTINAHPRGRIGVGGADLNVVRLFGENMVRYEGSDEWLRVPMSKMLRAYFNKFAEELKLEFRTGIRKF